MLQDLESSDEAEIAVIVRKNREVAEWTEFLQSQ